MQAIRVCDPLTPDLAYCEKIRSEVGEGPIITLNLVRFRRDGGPREVRRVREDQRSAAREGARRSAVPGHTRVRSSRAAPATRSGTWSRSCGFANIDRFLAMITDPTYQIEGRRLREESLERVIWLVTYPV